ncbi:MAG: MBL fold metallo-hydrolase [Candidatus Omnitrophica bacterium]|nr:MBL fold metallo-hydrolase [Candidatus Omnitrophota bacterium]
MRKSLFFFLFTFFVFSFSVFADQQLEIHFIDVGEGNSIFIETPGGEVVLIDAGNLISGFKLSKYLKKNKVEKIDHLIFTHPHLDHIGGSFFVTQEFQIENTYDSGEDLLNLAKEQDVYRWYADLVREDSRYRVLTAGDGLLTGEVSFKVLWPRDLSLGSDFNINSLVIMIKYKDFRCLLMADATIEAERELLKRGEVLGADILKVGHHGFRDASSEQFLGAVSADVAIISVNKDNLRGYPSLEVLERLKKEKAVIYRTDKSGTIVIEVNSKGEFLVKEEF